MIYLGNQSCNDQLTDEEEEMLIMEIKKREALWNYKLPVDRRGKDKINLLWTEVVQALNGNDI